MRFYLGFSMKGRVSVKNVLNRFKLRLSGFVSGVSNQGSWNTAGATLRGYAAKALDC
jgi:hypothetical protein